MEALARLDEYLAQSVEEPAETNTEEKDRFRIETREQAIWAMRKITAIERVREDARAASRAETERIKAWLEEEEKQADRARDYLDFLLEEYHRGMMAKGGQKTIKLPHGELQLRARQPEYQKDEALLKTWTRENRPELLVPQEPKLNWTDLKKKITVAGGQAVDKETGEVVTGITVIERPAGFKIKLELGTIVKR